MTTASRRTGPPRSGAARTTAAPAAATTCSRAYALPDHPPDPPPHDVPEASGGGATRNAEPLYDIAAQAHPAASGDRDAGARLLAARPRRHAERVRARMRHRRARRPRRTRSGRLPAVDHRPIRAPAPSSRKPRRWRNGMRTRPAAPASAAASPLPATRTRPPMPPWWSSSRSATRSDCVTSGAATDAGLVVNPDGAINQLEGGIIQSASWVLKEQVRFDDGVASFDWETYPVLKFSRGAGDRRRADQHARPGAARRRRGNRGSDRGGNRQRRRRTRSARASATCR